MIGRIHLFNSLQLWLEMAKEVHLEWLNLFNGVIPIYLEWLKPWVTLMSAVPPLTSFFPRINIKVLIQVTVGSCLQLDAMQTPWPYGRYSLPITSTFRCCIPALMICFIIYNIISHKRKWVHSFGDMWMEMSCSNLHPCLQNTSWLNNCNLQIYLFGVPVLWGYF